ncbi:UgpB ABC-type sugar transport system, periplasmic component [Candidatus Nanopelagicaceae bacterium]
MKIKKLRSKIAIAASLALSAGLVATGLPSAQAAGLQPTAAQLAAWKGKEITYYFYNDSQAELDTTKSQIADFEKLTGAKVKLDVIPYTSLDTQLQARLAAGNAPDVARLNNPGLYIKDSLDLEKYLGRKYAAEFLKGSTLQVTHPTTKKLIGVPYDLTVNGPFINVDMFKKAGVAVPTSWNWTELVAAGKKVQKATGSEYAFAIDKSGHRVSTAMSHFGAYMVDKNQRNVLPTSKFRAEKAIKIITDLYKADQAPRDLWIGTGTKYSSPTAIFLAQQTPIFFSGNWQVAALAKDAKFDFAAVPNPKELNGGGWPGGKFLVAFNASKTPDLAAYFLYFLADTAQMEQMDKNAFWLPTRADLVAQGVKYATRTADMGVFQADAAKTPAAAYGIQSVPTLTGNIYNKLRDLMTEVIAGKITAKQAVQTQIDFIDAQLATLRK